MILAVIADMLAALRSLTHLVCVALLLAPLGCGSETPDTGGTSAHITRAELDGRAFLLTQSEGFTPRAGTTVRLSFRASEVSFSAGCNGHFGSYQLREEILSVSPLGSTTRGCGREAQAQDEWLATFLSSSPRITRSGDGFTLSGSNATLTFLDREIADPDRPLVGAPWTIDTFIQGDAASRVRAAMPATLTFGEDGKLRFNTSCNMGEADYVVSGDELTFSSLGHTQAACPPSSTAEPHVLAVLAEGTVKFEIDARRLTIQRGTIGLSATRDASE